ncbi:anti-sigma factor [Propionivibrio sp.]|uniref:anti-sigma factor family protein n=1 Tax=Propionivibrio sp. TaxID=2212460 RepID=UPI0026334E77|nr:anti-sigma factor [Propionivibrio sp.]
MSNHLISETDLHAYVDGALPAARYVELENYFSVQADDAERVRAYLVQNQAVKAVFRAVLDEPLPENLHALASPPARAMLARPFLARWSLQRSAAGFVIALLGGVAGWLAHGQDSPPESVARLTPLPRQAAVAHAVFSPDVRRPVEVDAEHEDQLVAWLSKRLGTPVHPPRLGELGYELIGGRLLPGNTGPVAQFMYHDGSGQRLTLYLSTENASNQESAFRFAREGKVNVFYWIDGKFGYALSASIDKDELARVAKVVYEQIERK